MLVRKSVDDAGAPKVSAPSSLQRMGTPASETPRERGKAVGLITTPREGSIVSSNTGSIDTMQGNPREPLTITKGRGAVTTSSQVIQLGSLKARLEALRQHRPERQGRVTTGSVGYSVAFPQQKTEGSTLPRHMEIPSTSYSPPSYLLTPTTMSAGKRIALESSLSNEVDKSTSSSCGPTLGEPLLKSLTFTSTSFLPVRTCRSAASINAATADRSTQARLTALSCSASFNSSMVSTTAFSEAPVSNCPSIVFSVSDSPPSHPLGPAPMLSRDISPREIASVDLLLTVPRNLQNGLVQQTDLSSVVEQSPFPYSPANGADAPRRLCAAYPESLTSLRPVDTALGSIRVTAPDRLDAETMAHASSVNGAQSLTSDENSAHFLTSTTAAAESTRSSADVKSPISPFNKKSSSAAQPLTSAHGIPARANADAARRRTALDLSSSTAVTTMDLLAPSVHPNTTSFSETGACPQSFLKDEVKSDRREATLTRSYGRLDNPQTQRSRRTLCEASYPVGVRTVDDALSLVVEDEKSPVLFASNRDVPKSDSCVEGPVSRSPPQRLPPVVTRPVASSPSPVNASSPFPSSALYHAFLATKVRSKYKLLDDDATASTAASAVSDIISEELEMHRRLNRFRSGHTREEIEPRWRINQIRTP